MAKVDVASAEHIRVEQRVQSGPDLVTVANFHFGTHVVWQSQTVILNSA